MTIPWPMMPDTYESGAIPLTKVYNYSDFDYLDTPEARPMFERQADIVCERGIKTIVDCGCRSGPVLDILSERDYITPDFRYMGFDTSPEPIEIATQRWSEYPNIEFRVADYDDLARLAVPWDVDCVIWSAVLLYAGHRHREVFQRVTNKFYQANYAIIQEPCAIQHATHIDPDHHISSIEPELSTYSDMCEVITSEVLDLNIFSGRRVIMTCSM